MASNGNYGLLADNPLWIVKGAVKSFTLYSFDTRLDELGSEVAGSRTPSDLTGALITYTIWNADGTVALEKTSADAAKIEIAADQAVASDTRGTALLKFVAADTLTTLSVGNVYWHAARCAYADGRDDRILKKSRFYVLD